MVAAGRWSQVERDYRSSFAPSARDLEKLTEESSSRSSSRDILRRKARRAVSVSCFRPEEPSVPSAIKVRPAALREAAKSASRRKTRSRDNCAEH